MSRRRLRFPLVALVLSGGIAGLCGMQAIELAGSCGENATAIGTEGAGTIRQVGATEVRCRYLDVDADGRGFDFVIGVAPLVLAFVAASLLFVLALVGLVRDLKRAPAE